MDEKSIVQEIADISKPLRDSSDLTPLIRKIKNKKIVMLGEATHGTEEFYEWRKLISMELIRNHGFHFIAVEGDWPACQGIHEYIQGKDSSDINLNVMRGFSRWPTWMWGNTQILDLMDELRGWNDESDNEVGFHGLDVYSLYESIDEVIKKLRQIDTELAMRARTLYSCFEPYRHDERAYARSLFKFPDGCEREVISALKEILNARLHDEPDAYDVIQNARIVRNAEKYYRAMISQEEDSWNVRDEHMMETLDNLLKQYGPEAKAIVWAHNTHIGDYRATDMLAQGQINIGGLARRKYGNDHVALIGFSTFAGEVVASRAWDGPIEEMKVPNARTSSLEFAFHQAIRLVGHENYFVDFSSVGKDSSLKEYIGHRAIGVVYYPEHELRGNYVPTIPAERYDGMIFCNKTLALTPLDLRYNREKIPDTYPFGSRI